MSLATAFGLSLKNLFTKKGRTVLTAFAGSIGIIGIALIFSVSQGTTSYIDAVQEDTLSSYPLTLEAQHMDLASLLEASIMRPSPPSDTDHGNDAVYQKPMIYDHRQRPELRSETIGKRSGRIQNLPRSRARQGRQPTAGGRQRCPIHLQQ